MDWTFWRRDSEDPLVNLLYKKYNLNLLSIPQRNVSPGFVYRGRERENQKLVKLGHYSYLLSSPYGLPIGTREITEISNIISNKISPTMGLEFLEGFLNILIGSAVGTKVKRIFEKDTKSIQFQFNNISLVTMELLPFANHIKEFKINPSFIPLLYSTDHYYLVTGLSKTSSISVATESKTRTKNIEWELRNLVKEIAAIFSKEDAHVYFNNSTVGTLTFEGKRLTFGLVLHELKLDDKNEKFILKSVSENYKVYDKYNEGMYNKINPSFIGDSYQGSMFININQENRQMDELINKINFSRYHNKPTKGEDIYLSTGDDIKKSNTLTKKRKVNVWIVNHPSQKWLLPDTSYNIGLNIGYEKHGSILSVRAEQIEELSKKIDRVKLTVYITSEDIEISKNVRQLVLPSDGNSNTLYYRIKTKKDEGFKEITIFFYYELNLLQVISVPIEVRRPNSASTISKNNLKLETKLVASVTSGFDTINQLVGTK